MKYPTVLQLLLMVFLAGCSSLAQQESGETSKKGKATVESDGLLSTAPFEIPAAIQTRPIKSSGGSEIDVRDNAQAESDSLGAGNE
jgi:hypothetical protein